MAQKPVNQTYIAISCCCVFLFTYIFYLMYVMLPTYQTQLGMEPSYELSDSQKLLAQDKILASITHLPRWVASLIIISVLIGIYGFIKAKTRVLDGIHGFILSVIGIAVVISVGLIVMSQLHQEVGLGLDLSCTDCGQAYNTTSAIITQLGTVPNWIGIMVTVALAFIVLGYFYNRGAY